MPRNTSVTLGDHFDQYVTQKIAQGTFASVSEVVRAGLRQLEKEDEKMQLLRAKLAVGENSRLEENFDTEQFLKEMHGKHINES